MPGKKQFKEQADEGMMRAAWDLSADMTLAAGVHLDLALTRTARKGVFLITATATPDARVWADGGQIKYQAEWPRSEVATLAAAVFQAINKLDLMVGDAIAMNDWCANVGLWEP